MFKLNVRLGVNFTLSEGGENAGKRKESGNQQKTASQVEDALRLKVFQTRT